MREELNQKLLTKYPAFFKNYGGDPRETCMAWGFAIGDGWFDLMNEACSKISEVCEEHEIEFIAEQVKEKFGGLRFYYSIKREPTLFEKTASRIRRYCYSKRWGIGYNKFCRFRQKFYKTPAEKIRVIVDEAEIKSVKTCEACGKPGQRRGKNWVKTLCDNCNEPGPGNYYEIKRS